MTDFDNDMMRALQMDAAMLESMGAGEQTLAFEVPGAGMKLTNAAKDLWLVYDRQGRTVARGLSLEQADAKLFEVMLAARKKGGGE